MRKGLTLKELMEGLRYPSMKVEVMDCKGETIKTFESEDYDDYCQYQDCYVSTIKSECVEVKQNHFGRSELVISLTSIIIATIWGDRKEDSISLNQQKGE